MKVSPTVGLFVFLMIALPFVYAQPQLTVTVSPSSLSVPQGTVATYMVSLTGSRASAPTYSLSVDGLPGAAQGGFGSNPVTLSAGAASTSLSLDTSYVPLYCPGTYSFTVSASGSSGVSATSGPASLMVTQVGPSLQVSVSSDKPSYILGQEITITVTANRPAEGTLTIAPPSGAPMTYPFSFALGETYGVTETLTAAQPYGTWTMNVQADDYCGGTSNASGQFTVGPNTYDVHVSLSGLPANTLAGLQVDGAGRGNISEMQNKTLSFPIGTQHVITVDQYVYSATNNGTRYFAAQNSWTVTAAGSHVFPYQTQYLLTEQVGIVYGNRTFFGPPCCGNTTVNWSFFKTTGGYPLQTRIWYPAGTVVTLGQPVGAVSLPKGEAGTNGTDMLYVALGIGCNSCEVSGGPPPTIIMNGPVVVRTLYRLRYRLWVISYYGNLQLTGGIAAGINSTTVVQANNPTVVSEWYPAGATATATVTSPVGFTIQHVFLYWFPNSSVSSSTSPSTNVVMEGPMVLTAAWGTSYTLLYYEITGGIGAVAIIAVAVKYFGHGLHLGRPPPSGPGPVEEPVEEF